MIIKKDRSVIGSYLEDSSNLRGGYAEEVVLPADVGELSDYIRSANSRRIPVTVSGGGTGTTGSRIPFGGAVISLEKFNRILKIDRQSMRAVVQTGVMVDDMKKSCDGSGLFYTSHPTESTASVGGTVATNASGARSFKYGSTRAYVTALKMVLADGDTVEIRRGGKALSPESPAIVFDSGRVIKVPMPSYRMPEVKSSAGYFVKSGMDPIDLFIGQEGTLSVITEIELALVRKPLKILSSFVFFGKEEDAWFFAAEARDISKRKAAAPCGAPVDALSIEYFDSNALGLLRSKKAAIPESACSAIFFEQETSPGLNEEDALSGWMSLIKKHNASLDDTWVAMSEKDAENFTALRHAIPEAVNDIIRHRGFSKISTDIAVPDRAAIEMMGFYRSVLSDKGLEHVVFGHIGENHVHVNILPNNEAEAASAKEAALLFVRMGVSAGGSVSAEHGIGKIKRAYLEEMYGKSGIRDMARIKKAFDPHWILGQDNIFPKDLASQI